MIVRYVFIRLQPPYRDAAEIAELRARSQRLAAIAGVRAVSVTVPADADAASKWDLGLAVRFDTLAAVDEYLQSAEHEAYYEGYVEPRVQVIKAWNFVE